MRQAINIFIHSSSANEDGIPVVRIIFQAAYLSPLGVLRGCMGGGD